VTVQRPQVGPQLVEAQLPQESPPAVLPIFPEKADKRRRLRDEPQAGQATFFSSLRLSSRISKARPHLAHWNS